MTQMRVLTALETLLSVDDQCVLLSFVLDCLERDIPLTAAAMVILKQHPGCVALFFAMYGADLYLSSESTISHLLSHLMTSSD